jgi:hypothetical protein
VIAVSETGIATVRVGEKEQTVPLPEATVGDKVVGTAKDKEGTWECTIQKEAMSARAAVKAFVVVELGEHREIQPCGIHLGNDCQMVRWSGDTEHSARSHNSALSSCGITSSISGTFHHISPMPLLDDFHIAHFEIRG